MTFYSCSEGPLHYNYYEKAFFLGEEQFFVNGTVFENENHGTENEIPKKFSSIFVRTEDSDQWEIIGSVKENGGFECLITATANGVTISKETIQESPSGIVRIKFYLDDEDIFSCMAYYKENHPHTDGYRVYGYDYVYVIEPKDLSETYDVESNYPWHHITTNHKDLNFSKSGWYKIVSSNTYPINNDPKHSSGLNTILNR
jgi:hypothetical protein